ncbi:hypothetical protein I4U23_021361 [Adineta vaga]|nr:hypothetical protein I4U23_021361 [Adineta vaga]
MQVSNRTTRRYITPPGNIRPVNKRPTYVPSISHSSPKKAVDVSTSKTNDEPATLKKLVDRFRHDEPQARPDRESINSDFWWLHDELKNTYGSDTDRDDERKANIPEFIEVFPSTDIDHDLSKRASLLLHQTVSAHSSDIGHVSSVGIGSTPSTTMTTTTTSTFQPTIREQPARPLFTRITDSKFDLKNDGTEEDILYQWRLRRRLEQAHNGEPITFSSKVSNRTNISSGHSLLPYMPVEIPAVVPPPPPPIAKPLSPQPEKQQTPVINIEPEPIKQPVITPIPIKQYAESTTQTLQDACIQTSPTIEIRLSSSNSITNEIDLCPTRDENHHSSVWHRPPPPPPPPPSSSSKCELPRTSSSPSPVKRRHHHSFRPVVTNGHPPINDSPPPSHHHDHRHHHHQRSIIYPSNNVQSSQDSTLTQVTSIMVNDNNHHRNNIDHHEQYGNNTSMVIIDDSRQDDEHIDYSNDEILNILIQKRDELLVTFRDIEQLKGWIRVRNKGGYVARFHVDYHVLHSSTGNLISNLYLPIRLFQETTSSGSYPIGRTRVLDVPRNAVTARVRVERFIFYPFFGWAWKEIFRQEMNPQDKRCFDIWGTTAHPRWTSMNC